MSAALVYPWPTLMQMLARRILGARDADLQGVSGRGHGWGTPHPLQRKVTYQERDCESMACKEIDCSRRAHSLGYCTTHYRRWRTGQPMDAPIRRYRTRAKWRREGPFAAEYALLAELGLGRR
jgi:hypothetical protein